MRFLLNPVFKCLAATILLIMCVALLPGQTTVPATAVRTVPPNGRVDAFLEPFIDGETVVVAHLDAGAVDTAAIEKYFLAPLDEAKVAVDDNTRKDLAVTRAAADVF